MITDAQLSELEAKAKAATPGPWEADSYDHCTVWYSERDSGVSVADACTLQDGCFIAAANPATVLELVKELRNRRDLWGPLATISTYVCAEDAEDD